MTAMPSNFEAGPNALTRRTALTGLAGVAVAVWLTTPAVIAASASAHQLSPAEGWGQIMQAYNEQWHPWDGWVAEDGIAYVLGNTENLLSSQAVAYGPDAVITAAIGAAQHHLRLFGRPVTGSVMLLLCPPERCTEEESLAKARAVVQEMIGGDLTVAATHRQRDAGSPARVSIFTVDYGFD